MTARHDGNGGDVPDELLLSAERLRVGTEWRVGERWRVAKRVVTERRTEVVEVRSEELVIEPVDVPAVERLELNLRGGGDGPTPGEGGDEIEVVLHREEVVLSRRVVPYERVRVRRVTAEEGTEVRETVRRERLEVDREPAG